jgi:hypothetical protein
MVPINCIIWVIVKLCLHLLGDRAEFAQRIPGRKPFPMWIKLHGAESFLRNQVSQPVKKFFAFYGTRGFITMFTRSSHWSLSWAKLILSTFFPTCLRCIRRLSSHLRLSFPSDLIPSGFTPKVCAHLAAPPCVLHDPQSHPPWFDHYKRI